MDSLLQSAPVLSMQGQPLSAGFAGGWLPEPLLAFALFAVSMTLTPGPNNLTLAALGARFGLRAALPAVAGILLGTMLLLVLCFAGLYSLASAWPPFRPTLTLAGVAYLLWLAWRLAAVRELADRQVKPVGVLEMLAFQFVNPKAWIMALTATAAFLHAWPQTLLGAVLFAAIAAPCILTWAVLGATLRHWLRQGSRLAWFNGALATSMAATAVWMGAAAVLPHA